jgi:hypothetical protein
VKSPISKRSVVIVSVGCGSLTSVAAFHFRRMLRG